MQYGMANSLKKRHLNYLLMGGMLLACVLLSPKAQKLTRSGTTEVGNMAKQQHLLASPSHEDRKARKRRESHLAAAVEEALVTLQAKPGDPEAEQALIRALAAWAEEDIRGVHRWLKENNTTLPGNLPRLGHVLEELAKRQPRKALEFGMSLNEMDDISDHVDPAILLSIAVCHLTAEDAIRIMKMPQPRRPGAFRQKYFDHAPYSPDFDFQKLGRFIQAYTTRKDGENKWNPLIFPSNYMTEWTKHDFEEAYAHAVAMNPYASGTVRGKELMDVLTEYSKAATREQVFSRTLSILENEDLNISVNILALKWINESDDLRDTIVALSERLPQETRKSLATDIFVMTQYVTGDDAEARRAADLFRSSTEPQ